MCPAGSCALPQPLLSAAARQDSEANARQTFQVSFEDDGQRKIAERLTLWNPVACACEKHWQERLGSPGVDIDPYRVLDHPEQDAVFKAGL